MNNRCKFVVALGPIAFTAPLRMKTIYRAGLVVHGKNVGSGKAKVLATYVVEKGKPIATPVK